MANRPRMNQRTLLVACMMLFQAGILLPQTADRQGGSRGSQSGPPTIIGEVIRIDDRTIVIQPASGEQEEVAITPITSFAGEMTIDKAELREGDSVLIVGQPGSGNAIRARRVIVQEARGDERDGARGNAKSQRGDERGGTRANAQGQRGDRESSGAMAGPIVGTITSLNPLTVKQSSGETQTVSTGEATEYAKETSISRDGITAGMQVRVLAPPPAGGQRGKEAVRVMALQEGGISGTGNKSAGRGVESGKLLADLPQRPARPGFIIGIWLGRGLYSNKELDRAFRLAQNLGVKYFKVEFKWSYVEPENNQWRWNDERELDVEHVIKLARQYHLSIIPYFDMFMPWGETRRLDRAKGEYEGPASRRGQCQAPDPKEYAEYVFAVVDKLVTNAVDVRYIELDNEVSNLNDGYRSMNAFISVTAMELKAAENAAYDKVKAKYPDIMVSSTTFSFPGIGSGNPEIVGKDVQRKNSFVKAYFEDAPEPKFDFLGLHETLSGSGDPWTTRDNPDAANYEYNFGSYHDAYDIWRTILDKHGHKDTPIVNLESCAIIRGKQGAQLIQRLIFAKTSSDRNEVSGWFLSQLTGSKQFSEGGESGELIIGITRLTDGYELRSGYYAYYTAASMLSKYPNYEGNVTGEINAQGPWVEKFSDDDGNMLYVAFIPYEARTDGTARTSLQVGPSKTVKVTQSDYTTMTRQSDKEGSVALDVTQEPIFVEVSR